MSRIVILTEGKSNPFDAKTATGVLRYRGDDVVAVLDSTAAGKRAVDLLGVGGDTPIVASLSDAPPADTLEMKMSMPPRVAAQWSTQDCIDSALATSTAAPATFTPWAPSSSTA